MRISNVRFCVRIFLGLWLLHQFALAPAAAETTHGTLKVSMTVLSSCEVRANSGALFGVAGAANHGSTDAAIVTCPAAYPFRANLTSGAATGFVASEGDAGLVFTGTRRVELSQLSGVADRGVANGIAWLTISY